ncbi:hypothetical protein LCGC14_2223870 [marine sediment metagenome]|uniref:Uncharacterized protein n=1 Tax=marine sediment metagenome TaxID=412755 RepID=A0A0F9DA87_9ZZZZ
MTKNTKQLKTISRKCGDYTQVVDRFAVFDNDARIGTVHKFTGHSGPTYYDPLRGTGGRNGDGKTIVAAGHIKRCYSMEAAVDAV